MSNHKTKRRDGPTSDYVRPLTTEEKERGVKVHPLPPQEYSPELKAELDDQAWRSIAYGFDETCGMMPDDEWRRVRDHLWTGMAIKEACDLIPESPMVMFGIAFKMELDMMAAIWEFEDYGLDDPIATPKIAPAKMQVPAILPQQLQDASDISDLADYDFGPQKTRILKLATELTEAVRFANAHLDNIDAQRLPEPFYISRNPFASFLRHPGTSERLDVTLTFERRGVIKFLWAVEHGPKELRNPALRSLNDRPFAPNSIAMIGIIPNAGSMTTTMAKER